MLKNLVVSHNTDMMTPEEAVAVSIDVRDGFVYNTPDITLKSQKHKEFIAALEKEFGEFEKFDYSRSKNNIYKKYFSENIRMVSSGNSTETYSGCSVTSDKIANRVWQIYLDYCERSDDVSLFLNSFFMNNGQLDKNISELKYKELTGISPKYYPYIDTDVMFDQFFTGSENIMLLVGEPGIGKSKMATLALKHALENEDILPYDKIKENPNLDTQFINAVYAKSTDVLANDKFWREIEKLHPDFCIIDDLDYMLTKRDAEIQNTDDFNKNAFLNQFLSFTDGVEKHNTKFIITTNQKYDDIDTALLRKGRLFDILELRDLSRTEALDVWLENNLSEDVFNDTFTSEKILPAELGSEISKLLNTRILTSTQPYLKEENISKVKSAKRLKKISL